MGDFIPARIKGYYQVVDATQSPPRPVTRRGTIQISGSGVVVEDDGKDSTVIRIPAGGSADASGAIQTTNATPVMIASFSVALQTGYRLQVDAQGLRVSDRTVGFAKSVHVSARRAAGAVQVGGEDEISSDISGALAAAALTVQGSGGDVQVWVTGVVGITIDWTARVRVLVG